MARCGDSPRAGVVGCGQEWNGTSIAHCVAKCNHSKHPDGRCHETFSSNSVADTHWVSAGRGQPSKHADPSTVDRLVRGERARTACWVLDSDPSSEGSSGVSSTNGGGDEG